MCSTAKQTDSNTIKAEANSFRILYHGTPAPLQFTADTCLGNVTKHFPQASAAVNFSRLISHVVFTSTNGGKTKRWVSLRVPRQTPLSSLPDKTLPDISDVWIDLLVSSEVYVVEPWAIDQAKPSNSESIRRFYWIHQLIRHRFRIQLEYRNILVNYFC